MSILKKISIITLVFSLLSFGATSASAEDETMKQMLTDSIYGGVIGGLVGGAAVLLSDKPEDNLSYILTGAGVGILVGAAYGIATSGVVQSVGEIEDGKFTLKMPTFQVEELYDATTNSHETINKIELVKLRF